MRSSTSRTGSPRAWRLVVEPHIQIAEIERARRERPRSIAAYDLFLSALPCLYRETDVDNRNAYRLFTKAIELEPDNAIFLVHAAWTIGHRRTMGWPALSHDDAAKCVEMTRQGLDLSPGDPTIMARGAAMLIHAARDYDWAMAALSPAVAANPNSLPVVVVAGIVTSPWRQRRGSPGLFPPRAIAQSRRPAGPLLTRPESLMPR